MRWLADELGWVYTEVVPARALSFARMMALLVVIAPTWLGPAMGPLVAALGGLAEHHCLCGMKRGECGCPECETLDHVRARERAARLPGVRVTCDTDGVAPSPAAPAAFLPATFIALVPPPVVRASASFASPTLLPIRGEGPPTPPPRQTRA
ncbi:MAG TPA: hypothetical protein VH054_03895 [Polyangiaceae bacterium]|jgi:hypothetical protein|nr:hypothetical protein [Polyangiaceae bacterium]